MRLIFNLPATLRAFLFSSILAFIGGCSTIREQSVEYAIYRLPTVGFKDVSFLGVAKPTKINAQMLDRFMSVAQSCGQYQKVSRLQKSFEIGSLDAEKAHKKIKSEVSKYQDARYVHGILVIEQLGSEANSSSQKDDLVNVKETVDHAWSQVFGYTGRIQSSLFGGEEIGPKITYDLKNAVVRTTNRTLIWRFLLYNKLKDVVIIDRKIKMSAQVSFYSQAPKIHGKLLENALGREMMEHISTFVCPKVADVERNLVARYSDSKADQLVEDGIDQAIDGKWEAAANQWKKAVLIDKRNAWAYHNLGIYYEKFGNIPAAMEEFAKAKEVNVDSYRPKLYDDALVYYRPKVDIDSNEARVYSISNAQWVMLHGGKQESYKVGRSYSVYRVKRLGEAPKFAYHGLGLIEVGKIRVVKHESPFVIARVSEFLSNQSIMPGDIIVNQLD